MALGEVPASMDILRDANIWICDSGASNHSTNSDAGARNKRETTSASLGHVGQAVKATSSIDVSGYFLGKDGKPGLKACLKDASFNAMLNFNLMSLTRMLVNGWRVTKGDETGIQIAKGDHVIDFNIVIPTPKGAVFACRFIRNTDLAAVSTEGQVRMNINKAHALLGHGDENTTRQTAKALGWVITPGAMAPCEHCAKAKAKQKNVVKSSKSESKATKPGERVYLDLSKVTVAWR